MPGERWQVVTWCVLQGIGNGLILSTVAAVVVTSVPANETGVAKRDEHRHPHSWRFTGGGRDRQILTVYAGPQGLDGAGYAAVFLGLSGAMAGSTAAAVLIPRDQEAGT